MTEHFTTLRRRDDGLIVGHCPEHGSMATAFKPTQQGFNGAVTEARAHDDMSHRVFRSVKQYRARLVLEAQEFSLEAPQ